MIQAKDGVRRPGGLEGSPGAHTPGPYAGGGLSDRRRYPRIHAEVLYRPAGLSLAHHRRSARDISLGGMRVFSDEDFRLGSRLDLEIQLADGSVVRCWSEVVWIVPLRNGSPASFDVGMKFTDMAQEDIQRLATVLSSAG